jgi:hypothetical protein
MLTYSVIDEALGLTSIYNDDNEDLSPYIIETTCIAISGEKHHNYGRKFSEEHKRKLSYAKKDKPKSKEHKRKMSEAQKKRVFSEQEIYNRLAGVKNRKPRRWNEEDRANHGRSICKPLVINNVVYESGNAACEQLGISKSTLTRMRLRGDAKLWIQSE